MDIGAFLNIEKKYALYTKQINGVNYWNYSRVQIWNFEICAEKLNLQEPHQKKKMGTGEQIKTAAVLAWNSIRRGSANIGAGVDIVFSAHERRVKLDGVYQCIYTGELAECFPNSITLDVPYEYKHLRPEANLKRYYVDYIMVLGNLYYHAHRALKTIHYRKTLALIKEQMEEPLKEILGIYRVQISLEKIYGILHKKLLTVECERRQYGRLLDLLHPKIIVEVVYYGMHNMILNELAKERGICTVELQHGAMHKDHAAYQINWKNVVPQLPDKIFLFSEFWKKRVNLPVGDNELVTAGFPYYERNLRRYSPAVAAKNGKTILFISQGTIGALLGEFAVQVAKEMIPKGYRLIYKLHPAEVGVWEEKYSCFKDSGIEVNEFKDRNIYECFSVSDIQVGVYSTAVYEGLGFGLRTFIYNIAHADTLYDLVESGYAQIVNTSHELAELLEEKNGFHGTGSFWADNALDTMEKELEKILGR